MDHPNFISDVIATLAKQLKGTPKAMAVAAIGGGEPVPAWEMIRPTEHQKVAIALHRAEGRRQEA